MASGSSVLAISVAAHSISGDRNSKDEGANRKRVMGNSLGAQNYRLPTRYAGSACSAAVLVTPRPAIGKLHCTTSSFTTDHQTTNLSFHDSLYSEAVRALAGLRTQDEGPQGCQRCLACLPDMPRCDPSASGPSRYRNHENWKAHHTNPRRPILPWRTYSDCVRSFRVPWTIHSEPPGEARMHRRCTLPGRDDEAPFEADGRLGTSYVYGIRPEKYTVD